MNYELLRELRREAGLTQEAMAHFLGYKNTASYCMLENGTVKCTVEHAKKIKQVLDLSLVQFSTVFLSD